jgi:hypothetical protein
MQIYLVCMRIVSKDVPFSLFRTNTYCSEAVLERLSQFILHSTTFGMMVWISIESVRELEKETTDQTSGTDLGSLL